MSNTEIKIKTYDDHCGVCPLIEWCGEPYELPHLCCDSRFNVMTAEKYITIAKTSKAGAGLDGSKFLEAISEDVLKLFKFSNR